MEGAAHAGFGDGERTVGNAAVLGAADVRAADSAVAVLRFSGPQDFVILCGARHHVRRVNG